MRISKLKNVFHKVVILVKSVFIYFCVIFKLCLCVAERRALRWFHHVPRLRQASPEGPEEIGGCTVESQRGAERWQVKGKTRNQSVFYTHPTGVVELEVFVCSQSPLTFRSSPITCRGMPCGSEDPCSRPL